MTVVNVQSQLMQEASAGFGEGTKPGGDAASRRGRYDVWDEDEEYDEEY